MKSLGDYLEPRYVVPYYADLGCWNARTASSKRDALLLNGLLLFLKGRKFN
jgi:hypothetical protein